ncbi:MAG TPA: hypothetical protein V6C76_13325 [Drouetiella sp.]
MLTFKNFRDQNAIAFAGASLLILGSQFYAYADSNSGSKVRQTDVTMRARCQSAIEITNNCNAFIKQAQILIAQADKATAETQILIAQADKTAADAKRLNGSAKQFGTTFVPKIRPLHGAQLAAARKMYQSDLAQFSSHVAVYREHNANVRHQVGECAASRAAYEKNKNHYTLHCKEFHMEDLPPPHVCVTMEEAVSNSASMEGRLKSSVKRLVDSQIELMKTEARAKAAIANSESVNQDVRKQHEINLREQELAVEFAQIEEEYKQLDIEKKTLDASGGKASTTSVRARVRK